MDVTDGCRGLTEEDADTIRKNQLVNSQALEAYKANLEEKVGGLYDQMAGSIVGIDAMVSFYLELYAHCDGSLRDLVRYKLAGLFRPRLRDSAQGNDLSRLDYFIFWFTYASFSRVEKEALEGGSKGLLGGEEVIRARLDAATKTDDLLKKSLIKPREIRPGRKNNEGRTSHVVKDKGLYSYILKYFMNVYLRSSWGVSTQPLTFSLSSTPRQSSTEEEEPQASSWQQTYEGEECWQQGGQEGE